MKLSEAAKIVSGTHTVSHFHSHIIYFEYYSKLTLFSPIRLHQSERHNSNKPLMNAHEQVPEVECQNSSL